MSEVKRYAVIPDYVYGRDKFGPVCKESELPHFVLASEYDAAQSELAALREELATSQLNLSIEQAKLSQVRASLTSAEQRNVELVELLRDIRDAPGGSSFNKHIDAALKPTESGASECP